VDIQLSISNELPCAEFVITYPIVPAVQFSEAPRSPFRLSIFMLSSGWERTGEGKRGWGTGGRHPRPVFRRPIQSTIRGSRSAPRECLRDSSATVVLFLARRQLWRSRREAQYSLRAVAWI
jgi:hypothetical protein